MSRRYTKNKKSIREIFSKASTTYFYATFFFPKHTRKDVYTLYAFVRVADDFVDNLPQDADGFMMFRRAYESALRKPCGDDIIDNFVSLAKRKFFDLAWVESFLDAMEADLTKSEYNTLDETISYMHGSAEVIGLMMCAILGVTQEAYEAAKYQGRAMQYINFLRDVSEDLDLGRVYIPKTVLAKYELYPLTKKKARNNQLFDEMMRDEINRYLEWQRKAEDGYKYLPKSFRVAVRTASDKYNWTAKKIQKNPQCIFSKKIKPSKLQVLLRGVYNWFPWR